MATYLSWGPDGVRIKDLDGLPEGAGRAVAQVTETDNKDSHTFRFKLHDKLGALNSLAKHLGMFVERQGKALERPPITRVEIFKPYVIGRGYVSDDEAEQRGFRVVDGAVDELPAASGAE